MLAFLSPSSDLLVAISMTQANKTVWFADVSAAEHLIGTRDPQYHVVHKTRLVPEAKPARRGDFVAAISVYIQYQPWYIVFSTGIQIHYVVTQFL